MAMKAIILIAVNLIAISSATRITLCGRNLPNTDKDGGAPDVYIKVFYAPNADAPLQFIAETHTNKNNRNPDWAEIYTIPDSGDSSQYLKFSVVDADDPDAGDQVIGEVTVTLARVHQQADRVVWTDILNGGAWKGYLVLKVQKDEDGAGDCSDITCPEDVNDQYFPHPSTCNAYCQCSNGVPIERPCAVGTVFDPNLDVCVLPDTYICPNGLKIVAY